MGRGRQKAKQTKVARELKYYSPNTDLDALRAELATGDQRGAAPAPPREDDTGLDERDDYADWASDGYR
ncbi:DUF3073 domain-containing protein [Spongisporangium articulatum]|uniref:DUF3073 domain-containing protein n=1 Tax=Spongisporangium articulatum TaxID=3362603 RepID=A0ABW8AHA4_9ACTN